MSCLGRSFTAQLNLFGFVLVSSPQLRVDGKPAAAADRYHKISYSAEQLDTLLVDIFLEAHATAPAEIVLDLDVTDTPLHGEQEARFFHGYYGEYCYLPLYIFCGEHLLCARQRASNQDASAGALAEVKRIVGQIRQRWPEVKIILRADSGFCREELMAWCEAEPVHYVFGLARNSRLEAEIAALMAAAQREHQKTQQLVFLAGTFGRGRRPGVVEGILDFIRISFGLSKQ